MTTKPDQPSHWLDVDDIKRRVDIATVLEHYGVLAGLKGSGAQLSGHSPFRQDQRPSFSVNIEKGVWNDLGGRPVIDGRPVPGNVVGLVMAFESCSFRDALLKIKEKFLHGEPASTAAQDIRGRTAEALRVEDVAATDNVAFGHELGGLRTAGIPYFDAKGLKEETVKAFGAGYCSRGLMKSRIVFPIRNAKAEIVAYAGRSARDGQEPKYRFPSGFRKHLELYNIERVANDAPTIEVVRQRGLIVVEGFTDAMKLTQEGFPNVVALMGTDFHEAQRAMLLDPKINPTRQVTLFLDDDEAGHKGELEIAKALVHDAFVRCVDYKLATSPPQNVGPLEPEHFGRDDFGRLLAPQLPLPVPNPKTT